MKPILDWSDYRDAGLGDAYADIPRAGGDFAKAVAVCISSRQCESIGKGVMCPSFRVGGESDLSPGGRVRLLKSVLNADAPANRLSDQTIERIMAQCVGCKGCKRECENGLDMAMIKIEYLAQRRARRGLSLRSRVLGRLPRHLHQQRLLRRLLKWRNRSPLLARLGARLFGISARRRLPEPVTRPFTQRQPLNGRQTEPDCPGEVVLLIDTFTNHFAPRNAHAAMTVLQRAGYRVFTARPGSDTPEPGRPLCCGRTHLAQGMVDEAKAEARRMLAALKPHLEAGRKIIGLEPACLLAIRDDYRFLDLGEDAVKASRQALLFEEFIAREMSAKRFKLDFKPVFDHKEPLLVHGHCHQKAVGAMKAMRKVLKAVPGLRHEMIESSCCGMAGSFGIEQEHADLSMEMAEFALLPALRQRPKSRILANGFSCRQQIREGVDRPSIHLAVLLQEAL